jgi:glycosyltransferase involved in cell wall biosynthesis
MASSEQLNLSSAWPASPISELNGLHRFGMMDRLKSDSEKKFSIIIPTRNGAPYVFSTINSILRQSYESCEVVVSVNHSTDETLSQVRSIDDPRVRVVVPPAPLSMTLHYEWCLKQARGEWITILGDDDGLMPYFFDEIAPLIGRCSRMNVDVISSRRAHYFWPGCEEVYGDAVILYEAERKEYLVSSVGNMALLFLGLKDFTDLPHIYTNGIVRRTLIDKIRVLSEGRFYRELNPDVYSGVAVSAATARFLRTEIPLFWTGTSPKSVGYSNHLRNRRAFHVQQDSKQSLTRTDEFFLMAERDGVCVAGEVGQRLWAQAESSQMYVLSALCKLPFSVYSHKAIKRIAIYLAFACELRRINKLPFGEMRSTLESALAEQITKNNLLRLVLWGVGNCARVARLIIRFVQHFTVDSTNTTFNYN